MAPWIVPFGVQVREYSGELVATLTRPVAVNELCARVAEDSTRYPLLSGIDEHDDTYFNRRQARRLILELKDVAGTTSEPALLNAATEIMTLADLLMAAPGRPVHRQLVFIGD